MPTIKSSLSDIHNAASLNDLDLVDEMEWEDRIEPQRWLTLEAAGLEESDEPLFGQHYCSDGSIYSYTEWFYDGDESAFSVI
jgi:hypothetical protein